MSRDRSNPDWDDGRTIADMSAVERPALFLPRRSRRRERAPEEGEPSGTPESAYTPQEQRWAVLGALRAGLMIALAYALGLGLVILILLLIWR